MSKINNENYYQVSGWMLNELQLKGIELQIYAIIYGFTQSTNCYSGGLSYLEDWTGVSRPTVIQSLKNLINKNLLQKERIVTDRGICCIYKALTGFDLIRKPVEKKEIKSIEFTQIEEDIDIQKEENNIPYYIQQPYMNNKSETQAFIQECFSIITEHNKTAKHKIPISKDIFSFSQSYNEGKALLELTKKADVSDLRCALKNYLSVANSRTWMNTFKIPVFCKNYVEYSKEFFDMAKYINIPKDKVKLINEQLDKSIKEHLIFRQDAFIYHRKDWFSLGMPEGKELQDIVKQWEIEDAQNNINYQFALVDWEKEL